MLALSCVYLIKIRLVKLRLKITLILGERPEYFVYFIFSM